MRFTAMGSSFLAVCLAFGTAAGQEPKPGEVKGPAKEVKVEPKAKGQLPMNWKQLGLTDDQTQKVYKIQAKYGEDIDKLDLQIKELKAKITKERNEVLTADQKKRLEEILKTKSGAEK